MCKDCLMKRLEKDNHKWTHGYHVNENLRFAYTFSIFLEIWNSMFKVGVLMRNYALWKGWTSFVLVIGSAFNFCSLALGRSLLMLEQNLKNIVLTITFAAICKLLICFLILPLYYQIHLKVCLLMYIECREFCRGCRSTVC